MLGKSQQDILKQKLSNHGKTKRNNQAYW